MSIGGDPSEALELGGVLEESLELIRTPLDTDEYRNTILKQNARQIVLMEQIARNTGSLPSGPVVGGGDDDSGSGSGDENPREPTYYTTEQSIDVTSTEWETEEFGFVARTTVLIFDDEVDISFADPSDNNNVVFTLSSDKSPFTLSGVDGIYTPRVYYKQGDDASGTPTLDIIAIQ